MKIIDFNVAIKVNPNSMNFIGCTGRREWSAPETRDYVHNSSDFKIDCWTLGCIMYFLCTGKYLFRQDDNLTAKINFDSKLTEYSDSQEFPNMINFISRLLTVDPEERMSAKEAL